MNPDLSSTQTAYGRMRRALLMNRGSHGECVPFLRMIFQTLEQSQPQRRPLTKQVESAARCMNGAFSILEASTSEPEAAKRIHDLVSAHYDLSNVWLMERASYLASLVESAVGSQQGTCTRILDYGCGDGEVSLALADFTRGPRACCFDLFDVYDGRSDAVKESNMRFATDRTKLQEPHPEHGPANKNGKPYDLALLLTVLHHCEDPDEVLDFVCKLSDRIVIIESVIGSVMSWPVQMLVDWFYNRCLHPGHTIPVPGNFRTFGGWLIPLEQRGFTLVGKWDLGIDLTVAPEHHWLLDFERRT